MENEMEYIQMGGSLKDVRAAWSMQEDSVSLRYVLQNSHTTLGGVGVYGD